MNDESEGRRGPELIEISPAGPSLGIALEVRGRNASNGPALAYINTQDFRGRMCGITHSSAFSLIGNLPLAERLAEGPLVRFPVCLVAPAGGGPESAPVENRDIAAAVSNQPPLLQRARRVGDADSTDAKHQGKELVRDVERVRMGAILGHQQPLGEPRLDDVEARARRRLGELSQTDDDVASDFM